MVRQLTHTEVTELLGPLALDALDNDERNEVEGHVRACGACRAELADHREVASLLTTGWAPAPEGLWDRIASSLEEAPPPLDLAPVMAMRQKYVPRGPAMPPATSDPRAVWSARRMRAAIAAMVAVAALAIGVTSYKVVSDGRRIDDIAVGLQDDELQRAANAALVDPDARKVTLRSDDGSLFVDAVMLDDGTGYLVKDNLPALSVERSYQLWAVVGGETISVGVLGSAPGRVAFRAAGPVGALAITEEVAGGVEASQGSPLVVGLLTA